MTLTQALTVIRNPNRNGSHDFRDAVEALYAHAQASRWRRVTAANPPPGQPVLVKRKGGEHLSMTRVFGPGHTHWWSHHPHGYAVTYDLPTHWKFL